MEWMCASRLGKGIITRHITKMAAEKEKFERIDLVVEYFGQYHTDEWQERLNHLVSKKKIYANDTSESRYRIPNETFYSLKPFGDYPKGVNMETKDYWYKGRTKWNQPLNR